MAPEIDMPRDLRAELAGHYVSHARLQQRFKYQFSGKAHHLPEEAGSICDIIKCNNLEPEIMEDINQLSVLSKDDFTRQISFAQNDLLDTTMERLSGRCSGMPCLSKEERIAARNQISATRMLLTSAHESGIYSNRMEKANRHLFGLSKFTGGTEASLVGPEIVRRGNIALISMNNRKYPQNDRRSAGRDM